MSVIRFSNTAEASLNKLLKHDKQAYTTIIKLLRECCRGHTAPIPLKNAIGTTALETQLLENLDAIGFVGAILLGSIPGGIAWAVICHQANQPETVISVSAVGVEVRQH